MVNVNVIYTNDSAAQRFVESCENNYNKNIEKICDSIVSDRSVKIITLCGPTCSGKTTTAARLTDGLEKRGKKAKVISIDDFYFDESLMMEKNITNFEVVDAIDLELFSETVSKLVKGEKTIFPLFDFKLRKRVAGAEYVPEANDIYIIEGIQAMYPEVSAVLKQHNVKSIFINVTKDVTICDIDFRKDEIRLMRRIVRDYFNRGSAPEKTMELWGNVRENEEKSIIPYANNADYLINSLLLYEVFVISKYFIDITEDYNATKKGYEVVRSLRERLSSLTGSCISSAMVPKESVFREFIV